MPRDTKAGGQSTVVDGEEDEGGAPSPISMYSHNARLFAHQNLEQPSCRAHNAQASQPVLSSCESLDSNDPRCWRPAALA